MIELHDGMLLYHGSYTAIPHIDLNFCVSGLDFGKGFYLTSDRSQAIDYVEKSVRKAKRVYNISKDFDCNDGRVSVFKYHENANTFVHYFLDANVEWLHFVATNRDNKLFPMLLKKFSTVDIIGGKIADDSTAPVLQKYIAGDFDGPPGSLQADTEALSRLIPNKYTDQFCFRTQDAISCLEFVRSERYGDIRK